MPEIGENWGAPCVVISSAGPVLTNIAGVGPGFEPLGGSKSWVVEGAFWSAVTSEAGGFCAAVHGPASAGACDHPPLILK